MRPAHSSTSAPRMYAASASSAAVSPLERLVITLTRSIGSSEAPPMTSTFRPARSPGPSRLMTAATMSPTGTILAFLSSILGPISSTPISRRASMFLFTPGCSSIDACMAGATRTGMPPPMAMVAMVVTAVSSMASAILDSVLAVHGEMSRRSARSS